MAGPPPQPQNDPTQNDPNRPAAALRLLVLADLAAGREAGPFAIENGVDAALAAVAPALSLALPSPLGPGSRDVAVSLGFTRLDDFHPDAIAGRLPAATPGTPETGVSSPLDGLLAQVDLPAGQSARAPQVTEIVKAESFRALEAGWRGVELLARYAESCPAIRLEILAAPKEAFLDAFFERVFPAEHEGTAEVPLSAVVLGYELDRGPGDVEMLRHVARMGESLRVPFLAAVGAPFWGLRQARLLAGLPDLVRKLQGPEYAKWNGLRAEEAAHWLCIAANRVLLRSAWDGATEPLWGSGAYAAAAVLIRGFAVGGVGFPLVGEAARLADLGDPPVEVLLPDAKILELSRLGLVPLAAARGETAVHLPALPVLHSPKRYVQDEATLAAARVATLPYQAFAGAAAHALQDIARATGRGYAAEEVQQRFAAGLLAFLAGAEAEPMPEEVEVEVLPGAEDPEIWEVLARLRPKFQIAGGEVDLALGSAVAR
jgi:type VI secretion system protein ImpC